MAPRLHSANHCPVLLTWSLLWLPVRPKLHCTISYPHLLKLLLQLHSLLPVHSLTLFPPLIFGNKLWSHCILDYSCRSYTSIAESPCHKVRGTSIPFRLASVVALRQLFSALAEAQRPPADPDSERCPIRHLCFLDGS